LEQRLVANLHGYILEAYAKERGEEPQLPTLVARYLGIRNLLDNSTLKDTTIKVLVELSPNRLSFLLELGVDQRHSPGLIVLLQKIHNIVLKGTYAVPDTIGTLAQLNSAFVNLERGVAKITST
jgi:hypothetical protein